MDRVEMIRTALEKAFQPEQLDIQDESHLHAGHAGAEGGGGHFAVTITAKAFAGKSRMEMHRMINRATSHLFGDIIHALRIDAKAAE